MRRQSTTLFAGTSSFIFGSSLMGNIGSFVMRTLPRRGLDIKRKTKPQPIRVYFRRAQAGSILSLQAVYPATGKVIVVFRSFRAKRCFQDRSALLYEPDVLCIFPHTL